MLYPITIKQKQDIMMKFIAILAFAVRLSTCVNFELIPATASTTPPPSITCSDVLSDHRNLSSAENQTTRRYECAMPRRKPNPLRKQRRQTEEQNQDCNDAGRCCTYGPGTPVDSGDATIFCSNLRRGEYLVDESTDHADDSDWETIQPGTRDACNCLLYTFDIRDTSGKAARSISWAHCNCNTCMALTLSGFRAACLDLGQSCIANNGATRGSYQEDDPGYYMTLFVGDEGEINCSVEPQVDCSKWAV